MTGDYHAKVDGHGRLQVPASIVTDAEVHAATRAAWLAGRPMPTEAVRRQLEAQRPTTETVQVPCPQCGNANRAARRRCRRSGPCAGTGMVTKRVPTVEAQARAITDAAFSDDDEQGITDAAAAVGKAFGYPASYVEPAIRQAIRAEQADDA